MWSLIKSYAENTRHPSTCKDIKEHLVETYGVLLDIHIIRKILKEKELNYRRNINYNKNRNKNNNVKINNKDVFNNLC